MSRNPAYVLMDFLKACQNGTSDVYVQRQRALLTAREQLQLFSEDEILDFVGRLKISELTFCNTGLVEKTDDRPHPEFDAYSFNQHFKVFYLAFFMSPSRGRWILKSLHLSDYQNFGHNPFGDLIDLREKLKPKKDGR